MPPCPRSAADRRQRESELHAKEATAVDDLLTKRVPQALEAEQSVLGAMLIDSRCVSEVVGLLRAEDFYLEQNRELFEAIYAMFSFSQPIDPVTVLDKLRELGTFHDNTQSYLMQLMEITPTAAHAKEYAAIVAEKATLRRLQQAATDISEAVIAEEGTVDEILESAEKKVYAVRRGSSDRDLVPIGTVLMDVYDRLNELALRGDDIPGLSTGFRDLDRQLAGLNKSDLLIIAGRPGMGKTSMALNLVLNVARKSLDKCVAFFSLEMSREQLAMRLLSSESFVDNRKLLTGKLDDEEWGKLGIASSALSQMDIRVDDNPAVTVTDMNAKCRRIENLGMVIIDYLQLMSGGGRPGDNRVTIVSEISRSLKIMAKELNVPVICLSQLSRASESRTDKRPLLSDLRESGAIEQDADEVIFLYRDDYYNENTEEPNVAELIVAKNRHGETGTVKVQWLPQFTTFSDREWKHSE